MKFLRNSEILDIFFNAPGARPWSLAGCVLIAGILNMLSMGAMLPAISQMGGEGVASDSRLNKFIVGIVETAGFAPTLTNFVILLGVLLTLKSLLALAAMTYVASSVSAVQAEIRRRLLTSVMRARWGYFVDLPPGKIANSIGSQTMHAGEAYFSSAMVIVAIVQTTALLTAATLISGYMVVITLIAAIIISFPLYKLIMQAREAGKKQWQGAGQLGSKVQDAVGNMKVIRSMNQGATFSNMFENLVKEMQSAYFVMNFSRHALSHGQDIMIALTVVAGFYVGTQVIKVPLSDLLVLGIIYYQIIILVKQIQQNLQQAAIMRGAYSSLMDMIDKAQINIEHETGTNHPQLNTGCRFEKVDFAYDKGPVLKQVDLEIPAGEVTVLLGPSGAGKTTIIDLLIGLLAPISGRITVDGVPIGEIDLKAWRSRIGYVPQELTLLHGTICDNVTLGDTKIAREDVWIALRTAGLADFIEKLPRKLDTPIGTMGSKLSGGQRQRLSLARALVRKPSLLILDEVTSALDEKTEATICQNIAGLGSDYTIVAITHRPAWKNIATRLYEVNEGQVSRVLSAVVAETASVAS